MRCGGSGRERNLAGVRSLVAFFAIADTSISSTTLLFELYIRITHFVNKMPKLSRESRAGRVSVDVSSAIKLCYAASLLIIVGQIMLIVEHVIEVSSRTKMDYAKYKSLDSAYLEDIWAGRRSAKTVAVFGNLFEILGWVFLWLPVSVFSDHLGKDNALGRVPPAAFGLLAVLVTVELTFNAGALSVGDWMSTWSPMGSVASINHTHDGGFGAIQSLEIACK